MSHNKMESHLWWRIACTRRSARALIHCQALLSQPSLGVSPTLGSNICPGPISPCVRDSASRSGLCCPWSCPAWPWVLPRCIHILAWPQSFPIPRKMHWLLPDKVITESTEHSDTYVKHYKVTENVCRCELVYTTVEFYWLGITFRLGC